MPNLDLSSKGLPNFDFDIPGIGELNNTLEEVSPPELIQKLKAALSTSSPTVEIIEPRENSTLDNQTIEIKLSVSGLSLYKDSILDLGPHVSVVLDDQPSIDVHDINHPIIIKNLKPGTHTLRAIAAYPWHESFKNPSAYDQSTFHVLTRTHEHDAGELPILTVSSIQERYTAEPILLDFVVRQASQSQTSNLNSKIISPTKKQVKATFNDQEFIVSDADSSLYLQGIKAGKNWIKLELEDEAGNWVKAPFSEQSFGFSFVPEGSSPLGKLLSEAITLEDAGGIVGHPKPIEPKPIKPKPSKPKPIDSQPTPSLPLVTTTQKVEPENGATQPRASSSPLGDRTQLSISPPERTPDQMPPAVRTSVPNALKQTSINPRAPKSQAVTPAKRPEASAKQPTIQPKANTPISSAVPIEKKEVGKVSTSTIPAISPPQEQTTPPLTSPPIKTPPTQANPTPKTPQVKQSDSNLQNKQSPNHQFSNLFQSIRQNIQETSKQGLKNLSDPFHQLKTSVNVPTTSQKTASPEQESPVSSPIKSSLALDQNPTVQVTP
jgi:hypothetical protein